MLGQQNEQLPLQFYMLDFMATKFKVADGLAQTWYGLDYNKLKSI